MKLPTFPISVMRSTLSGESREYWDTAYFTATWLAPFVAFLGIVAVALVWWLWKWYPELGMAVRMVLVVSGAVGFINFDVRL